MKFHYIIKIYLTKYAFTYYYSQKRSKCVMMDKIDLQISYLLGQNGRISNREIARQIGIAEGTVRQRLANLMEKGVLRIAAQVNIESFPEVYVALVGVKIDGRRLSECAGEVEKLPSVLTTMIVTGRYDLIAVVFAPSRRTLVDFVSDQLSKVQGIKDSETYVVLRNFGQWVAADKIISLVSENGKYPWKMNEDNGKPDKL
jgi:Lrp/AsnC family transcriptional regulator, regulator for asnA, asnC and gidA